MSGPLFRAMSVRDGAVLVQFDHADTGLMAGKIASPGKPAEAANATLNGFELCGEDGKWHPAKATIEEKNLLVVSDLVKTPVAVRYAYTNAPAASLVNAAGLPAAPFRTDDW